MISTLSISLCSQNPPHKAQVQYFTTLVSHFKLDLNYWHTLGVFDWQAVLLDGVSKKLNKLDY